MRKLVALTAAAVVATALVGGPALADVPTKSKPPVTLQGKVNNKSTATVKKGRFGRGGRLLLQADVPEGEAGDDGHGVAEERREDATHVHYRRARCRPDTQPRSEGNGDGHATCERRHELLLPVPRAYGYQPGHAGRLLLQERGHRDDGWSGRGIGGIRADAHNDRLHVEPRRDGLRLLSPVTLGLVEGVSAG